MAPSGSSNRIVPVFRDGSDRHFSQGVQRGNIDVWRQATQDVAQNQENPEQKRMKQRAQGVIKSAFSHNPFLHNIMCGEALPDYAQRINVVPGVDTSFTSYACAPEDEELQAEALNVHRSVVKYCSQYSSINDVDAQKVAYVWAHLHVYEKIYDASHNDSLNTVRETKQDLRGRRGLITQMVGFPNILKLVEKKGFLHERQPSGFSLRYGRIKHDISSPTHFFDLHSLVSDIQVEHSAYHLTGLPLNLENKPRDQDLDTYFRSRMDVAVSNFGWKKLVAGVFSSNQDEWMDQGMRNVVHDKLRRNLGASGFSKIARDSKVSLSTRQAATLGLCDIAHDLGQSHPEGKDAQDYLCRIAQRGALESSQRQIAIKFLGAHADAKAVSLLRDIFNKSERFSDVEVASGFALCQCAHNTDLDEETCCLAVNTLSPLNHEAAVSTFHDLLLHTDSGSDLYSAAWSGLQDVMKDDDLSPEVRTKSMQVLSEVGHPTSVFTIMQDFVRKEESANLVSIANGFLIGASKSLIDGPFKNGQYQLAAIGALRDYGHWSDRSVLFDIMDKSDDDPVAANAARYAVSQIAFRIAVNRVNNESKRKLAIEDLGEHADGSMIANFDKFPGKRIDSLRKDVIVAFCRISMRVLAEGEHSNTCEKAFAFLDNYGSSGYLAKLQQMYDEKEYFNRFQSEADYQYFDQRLRYTISVLTSRSAQINQGRAR